MKTNAQITGQQAEALACAYLTAQGLKLVTQNYRCNLGEIDLIMREQEVLVFVEVRFRKQDDYGDGAVTVTKSKQRKLIKTALVYLQETELLEKIPSRFDVIALDGTSNDKQNINWIKDAFWVEY